MHPKFSEEMLLVGETIWDFYGESCEEEHEAPPLVWSWGSMKG